MANSGLVTLGSLRVQSQERSDKVNSGFITTPEWNQMISNSYKELYGILATHFGDYYFVAAPFTFQTVSQSTNTSQLYALPNGVLTDYTSGSVAAPFYKLLGVDLQVTSSPSSWVTMLPFEFTERNNFWAANQYMALGYVVPRYKVMGSNIWLAQNSTSGQTVQLWYVPEPANLQPVLTCGTTSSSGVITCSDTSQLSVGMNVADRLVSQGGTAVVPAGATIGSISTNVSFTLASAATCTATKTNYLISCWSDATTMDGISGWEEYIIADCAIKGGVKEESVVNELMGMKAAVKLRIEEEAANRDASIPSRVTDTTSVESGWPMSGNGWNH